MDTLKNWFNKEAAEVKATVSDVGQKLDSDITRREREMNMTPEEKIEAIQAEASDDPFAAARDKIEGSQSHALATEEVNTAKQEAAEEVEAASDAGTGPDGSAAEAAAAKDLRAAQDSLTRANEESRAEEILRDLKKEVGGETE